MKKNAFTLIELIAVLVILAILALIVTPLVINIIRKARVAADKRSIDAYGRSIELAIANYLLDNGDFPTSVDQLTIEYSGDEVVCSTTQLNGDSSVYLSGCTVGGRSVDYTYGSEEVIVYNSYEVGNTITYNGMNFYVISSSGSSDDSVTVLKETPLTVDEVNLYGEVGTANNHVNMYVTSDTTKTYYQAVADIHGFGGMTYYSSATCGYSTYSGCSSDYNNSDVKYVVDAWANDKFSEGVLKTDLLGYKARLITYEELITTLGYTAVDKDVTTMRLNSESTPSWMYDSRYDYWTMSPYQDDAFRVWFIYENGNCERVYQVSARPEYVVRPVITINKSALTS